MGKTVLVRAHNALHIGPLLGRSRVCLYLETPETLEPLAYFKSPMAAEAAMLFIDELVRMVPDRAWHGWAIRQKGIGDGAS